MHTINNISEFYLAKFGTKSMPKLVDATTEVPNMPELPQSYSTKWSASLSGEQLLGLAILYHPERSPTWPEVTKWLTEHRRIWGECPIDQVDNVIPELIRGYDPPVVMLEKNGKEFVMPWTSDIDDDRVFRLVVGHLGILFPAETPEQFPLMELPSELRLTIYEYALGLPSIGWEIPRLACKGPKPRSEGPDPQDRSPRLLLPVCSVLYTRQRVQESGYIASKPMDEVFALLSVSQKVRREAYPYFFHRNTFEFNYWPVENYHGFVRFGRQRASHLRHISIWYKPTICSYWRYWKKLFEKIRNWCTQLLTVKIHIYESCRRAISLEVGQMDSSNVDKHISAFPGLKMLAGIRGLKQVIVGESWREFRTPIQGYLDIMTQPVDQSAPWIKVSISKGLLEPQSRDVLVQKDRDEKAAKPKRKRRGC